MEYNLSLAEFQSGKMFDSNRSNLINTEYSNLIDALANLNQEIDPLEMKASAYVLSGHFENEDEFVPIKIIAMQNPITLPKHKFMQSKGKFKESDE